MLLGDRFDFDWGRAGCLACGVLLTSPLAHFKEKVHSGGLVFDGFGGVAVVVHADCVPGLFKGLEDIHDSGVWEVI